MGFDYQDQDEVEVATSEGSFIKGGASVHSTVTLGHFCVIGKAKIGVGVKIGHGCVIGDGVEIGDNTVLMNHVELRAGTQVGEHCYIDSGVTCTGNAIIGDHVTIRNNCVIARGCVIKDKAFLCPQVMFNNLGTDGQPVGGAHIGIGAFVGTNVTLKEGITVCDGAVIGAKAMVTKDITEKGIYVGVPAKRLK